MSQALRYSTLLAALLLINSHSGLTQAKDGSATKSGSAKTSDSTSNDGYVSLFNGKDLDGWIQRGGKAKYHIEDDAIVGTSVPNTANTFLCTPRDYANFILEVELKVDDGLNSGIQIRSHAFEKETTYTVKNDKGEMETKKIPANRVHGYQVEIDPSDRAYSGGIYDEARRGWLNDLSGEEHKSARQAFQNGEWNTYRIEAIGNSIKTWVNGVAAADLKDDMTATGFIGLQVHGIGNNADLVGKQVRWRNIMIKEVTK